MSTASTERTQAPEQPASRRPKGELTTDKLCLGSFNLTFSVFISSDTDFRQQRMKAWKPVITPRTTMPYFYICGVVFIIIGAVLLSAADQVYVVDRVPKLVC
jgi:hypothetical protein